MNSLADYLDQIEATESRDRTYKTHFKLFYSPTRQKTATNNQHSFDRLNER